MKTTSLKKVTPMTGKNNLARIGRTAKRVQATADRISHTTRSAIRDSVKVTKHKHARSSKAI